MSAPRCNPPMHTDDCGCEWDHGCHKCKCCGAVDHRYGDEPYCDDCGKPHPGYFGALRRMVGYGKRT